MKTYAMILACAMTLTSLHAHAAKRLGGGKSVGQQSSQVTQREAARPAPTNTPATPAQAAPNTAPQAQPAAATPSPVAAQPQRKPWGAMLGGLAAGLGLAWLAHSLGFGEAFGEILLMGLVLMLAVVLIGAFLRRRQGGSAAPAYAYQGAGATAEPSSLPQYNPRNVGNDASARPMDTEPSYAAPAARQGALIGSAIATESGWSVPAGFDRQGFETAAKETFVTLQKAWDRADIPSLRTMMTDGMLTEIRQQLAEREAQAPGTPNQTDVVMLEAQLLGIEDTGAFYLASVEFSGLIREDPSAGPTPFREVWNMSKPKDGSSGWLVAGVQALE